MVTPGEERKEHLKARMAQNFPKTNGEYSIRYVGSSKNTKQNK
jgi:hypothetical protein